MCLAYSQGLLGLPHTNFPFFKVNTVVERGRHWRSKRDFLKDFSCTTLLPCLSMWWWQHATVPTAPSEKYSSVWSYHCIPMLPATARDVLCRLSTYLEELEAAELKKFKLYLGTAEELGQDKIPLGRMEMAGPLEMAQLMVAHMGTREAWLLALSTFERIHRKDLWEQGQREDLVQGKEREKDPSLECTHSLCFTVSVELDSDLSPAVYVVCVRSRMCVCL